MVNESIETKQPSTEDAEKEEKMMEETILSIIEKVKKDRNRACVQNIHTFLNRRGKNTEIEKVKNKIEELKLRKVIVDKGKDGKESLDIMNLPSEKEPELEDVDHETNLDTLYDFIDEKFCTILINKINLKLKWL